MTKGKCLEDFGAAVSGESNFSSRNLGHLICKMAGMIVRAS